jgi:hypothetical protein
MGLGFGLPDEAVAWIQIVPYKGSLLISALTDPSTSSKRRSIRSLWCVRDLVCGLRMVLP